ncbi:integrase domain-containing protein [Vibrio campbellii]|uniref:integrase domain-containing protein n=1 Tax=Vibrio campbellii TaxID=680 RepID=UPI003D6BA1B3
MVQIKTKKRHKLEDQTSRFYYFHYQGIGQSKVQKEGKIHSFMTLFRHIEVTARIMDSLGIGRIKKLTSSVANNYIESRRNQISAKSLRNERKVLQRIVDIYEPGKKVLIQGELQERKWVNRAYTFEQVEKIMTHQRERMQLSTAIAFSAGLRAQELLTIRRFDEVHPSKSRKWRKDLFKGREGVKYIVKGKGGLKRVVMLPNELAEILETKRLPFPIEVEDRRCKIITYYDIAGGKKFSDAFSQRSKSVLGWSNGAHGLRYSYAQERMSYSIFDETYKDRKAIVSQELGHFREDITTHYLCAGAR